jgi:hypothetical protein
MNFWNRGPREWSPRRARGLRMLRELHDVFPKHMLLRYGDSLKVGYVHTKKTLRGDERFMLAFTVSFEWQDSHGAYVNTDGVWISPEGVIDVGAWIHRMLKEGLPGYPEFAGRWPWTE